MHKMEGIMMQMNLISGQDENKVPNRRRYEIKEDLTRFYSRASMKKTIPMVAFIVSILLFALVTPAFGADSASSGIKVYYNGEFQGSSAYIDPASGVGMVPLALLSFPGMRLDIRDNQAWFALNGRQLHSTVGSNTYTMDGQSKTWRSGVQRWQYGFAVPGRDLFEALGASVRWDENERAIYITAPVTAPAIPNRLSEASLPLRLAFIQDEQLWLLDAGDPGAQPFLVPSRNIEQIIGWSYDGKWLAYLQRAGDDEYAGIENLWVVSSNGQQPQCLNEVPIAYNNTPVWSPTENIIAYQAQGGEPANSDSRSLWIAVQENSQWQCHELLPAADRTLGSGLTWFPDGQSLAVSWVHDEKNLPELDRVDLQGRASCLFVLPAALAGDYQDGMFIRDINGLQLSPDGRYLACFLGMNSGSINADGMGLQIIDLQQETSFQVGCALGYPEWAAWSPDGQKLAAILGCGRTASTGKHLALVQIDKNGFKVQDLGETGQVDSRPIWDPNGDTLYFTRGQESEAWLEEGRHQEIQVPGQRIFCRRDEQVQSLSKPGDEQADYPLSLSPDGQYLAVQRLDYADLGTLCLMNLKDGQMLKLMDQVQADAGYYGNYYPDRVSIYWTATNLPNS
ncbi:MAG: stalk domain-containing protein [Syntrophomonadaceae bacterium]|nr:stalk domain-containing protein [Syntrophomonadaceae bacterium]